VPSAATNPVGQDELFTMMTAPEGIPTPVSPGSRAWIVAIAVFPSVISPVKFPFTAAACAVVPSTNVFTGGLK